MFAKEFHVDPIRRAQLHAAEERRLLEGNRVLSEMESEAHERASSDQTETQPHRKQDRLRQNRKRVRDNADDLREKWGVAE